MLKTLLTISLLLLSTFSFGQTETKEEFLNEVYKQVIDTNQLPCNILYYTQLYLKIDDIWKRFVKIHKNTISSKILKQIVQNVYNDTTLEKWNCNSFTWCTCTDNDKFFHKKKHDRFLIKISKPLYDKTHRYAVIQIDNICGFDCGISSFYLFQKVDNKWLKIDKWDEGAY